MKRQEREISAASEIASLTEDKRFAAPQKAGTAWLLKTLESPVRVFALLTVVAFLLRIFYAANLYQDDGLWFTAGEELLRGKALYREIYFDKPPVLPLVYALLFKLFGAHILTVRLFTVFYSLAVAFALYKFAAWLYKQRADLLAAALFVVFSTTYTTGHFQGLNTDLLMLLPYTLGAFWLLRAGSDAQGARLALAGGAAIGIAFQTNPKAIFDLFLVLCSLSFAKPVEKKGLPAAPYLLLTALGFALGALPFWLFIAATHSLTDYWHWVWDWGARYAAYNSFGESLLTALRQSFGYFALNISLLVALLFVAFQFFEHLKAKRVAGVSPYPSEAQAESLFKADATLLFWFGISYLAMSIGGRFYGHYFFQILPSLCLIGARGLSGIVAALASKKGDAKKLRLRGESAFLHLKQKDQPQRHRDAEAAQRMTLRVSVVKRAFAALQLHLYQKKMVMRRVIFALLLAGFAFTIIRFHARTAVLAFDFLRGTKSEIISQWFHERLNREEREAAGVVKGLCDIEDARDLGFATLRRDSPRLRQPRGSEDYLFVWGYRPELYYWSGLLPASRFLSTQPLTGVPADVQFFGGDFFRVLDDEATSRYRAQLLEDLRQTPPKYIVDELGFYNSELAMDSYPELKDFLSDYKVLGNVGRFFIYRRRPPKEKKGQNDHRPALQTRLLRLNRSGRDWP